MHTGVVLEFLNMGGGEIILILAVVMLLFGGKKLPELARGLGKGIRDFKDASEGVKREIHRNINAVDIDNELNAERHESYSAPANPTLEEQMYPKSEPVNLTKHAEPLAPEGRPAPPENLAAVNTAHPESDKNQI